VDLPGWVRVAGLDPGECGAGERGSRMRAGTDLTVSFLIFLDPALTKTRSTPRRSETVERHKFT
jgi:hypothetical protein